MITYGAIRFDSLESRVEIGSILIIMFSFSSLIILMNLLIAILSNTFVLISKRSKLEQAAILYENYKDKRVDRYYSAIIIFPAPFNMMTFVFIPIILIIKN
jgi:hypothetical protein